MAMAFSIRGAIDPLSNGAGILDVLGKSGVESVARERKGVSALVHTRPMSFFEAGKGLATARGGLC